MILAQDKVVAKTPTNFSDQRVSQTVKPRQPELIEPFIIVRLAIDDIALWFCLLIPKTENDGLQL